jgi:predicted O-methyltransferase YrrM
MTESTTTTPPLAYKYADWITYMTHAEIDFLMKLARGLPKRPMVINIGAGVGTSGLAFLESRPDLIYYSVDIRNDENPIGGLVNEKHAFEGAGYWNTREITQVHGDSGKVGLTWNFGKADLIFVDGDHTHEGCWADWVAWKEHVKPGGIIVFHDYKGLYGPGVETTVIEAEKIAKRIGVVDVTIALRMPKK